MSLIVGIDASRNRSGGAKAHLIGIISEGDPLKHGIREVHIWAFKTLLDALPNKLWLVKHNPKHWKAPCAVRYGGNVTPYLKRHAKSVARFS